MDERENILGSHEKNTPYIILVCLIILRWIVPFLAFVFVVSHPNVTELAQAHGPCEGPTIADL
jgi:hypothetical protein